MTELLLAAPTLRTLIEVDELRTQAGYLAHESERGDEAGERLRDEAATGAAVRLARPLLKCGVQVLILDYLGCRFGEIYREGLSTVGSVLIVRLDAAKQAHQVRNRSRPQRRQFSPDILDFLRTSAQQEGHADLAINTTRNQPDQTARDLESLLRA